MKGAKSTEENQAKEEAVNHLRRKLPHSIYVPPLQHYGASYYDNLRRINHP